MIQWQHITPKAYKKSTWVGGETTELFIYPPNAEYQKRDFGFRISSATVTLEQSEFTALSGVMRHIMPLSGEIQLIHDGAAPVPLKPYEVNVFSGDHTTTCFGTCTDYNLMLRQGWQGKLYAMHTGEISLHIQGMFLGIYAQSTVTIAFAGKKQMTLLPNELCMLHVQENIQDRIHISMAENIADAKPCIITEMIQIRDM